MIINHYIADSETDENTNISFMNKILLKKSINSVLDTPMDYYTAIRKSINIKPGKEMEFLTMFINCCCEHRTYIEKFGIIAQVIILKYK